MKKSLFRSKATPLIACILCSGLYFSDYFQIVFAALIVLLASAMEYGKRAFRSLGFQRRNLNVANLLIWAPLTAGMLFAAYLYILIPGITKLTGHPIDFSQFEQFEGNLPAILGFSVFVWVSAAFGEEVLFRGYLMNQFSKFFGEGALSVAVNIALFGIIFGFVHSYQGISGQIITGIIGASLAFIFYLRKHDLWFNIFVHGFFDTIALGFIYYGFWGN